MSPAILESTLTCPYCGARSTERMPSDACLFFWYCPSCEMRVRPKTGDCCVFCSYGTVPCPSRQRPPEDPDLRRSHSRNE